MRETGLMSFLDNLENSLKSLEKEGEREQAARAEVKRRLEMTAQAASAPFAQRLKESQFTEQLLRAATEEGHRRRTKVYMTWIGPTLRLEAREKRLELHPTPTGVEAISFQEQAETGRQPVDLESNPAVLVREWLR